MPASIVEGSLGGLGRSDLDGGSGTDGLLGGGGNDDLRGGADDDRLDGGSGADLIDGGPAGIFQNERHDVVDYSNRPTGVTVDLTLPDSPQGATGEGDIIRDVEDVTGGDGNDTLLGHHASNNLSGGEGIDHLEGREGKDVLHGGLDRDTLIPSSAADGQADIMDCDDQGPGGDGDNGDLAFRFSADGDFVNDCEQVLDL